MTTAPAADQLRLLDVQAIDTRLAQLNHQRRTHPSIAALAELTGRAEDLGRAKTANEVQISDTRRELSKAETDVEQVATRAERDRQRLESGAGSAKDLQALSSEVEALAKRQSDLEEVQLEVMERMDAAQSDATAIAEQSEALEADIDHTTSERDQAFAAFDAQIEENQQKREKAAEGIDEGLMKLYERIRAKTGGLAAVGLRGTSADGLQVPLSLTEKDALANADPDEVICSEDYDYILVRVE